MLRPIETQDYAAIVVPSSFGSPPKLEWLSISSLVIDPEYQREITPRGRANVRRIAIAFDWAMFSPVIVAPVGSGQFAIVDGQHRTTAAKLCGIDRVPCVVIDVGKAIQAQAFKAINGNVTRMHTVHLHHASVAVALADQRKLDDVVRILGIEDSEDDPSEVCKQIMDERDRLLEAIWRVRNGNVIEDAAVAANILANAGIES